MRSDLVEICLGSATAITDEPFVVPLRLQAVARPRLLRPPLRYVDQAALERAWRRASVAIRQYRPDVLYLNPCRFLQAPPVLRDGMPPALYFCDEPRRVDSEEAANANRNPLTRPIYGAIYARQRRLDRETTARAARVATNSRYTAAEISRVYGRRADVIRMGVADSLRGRQPAKENAGFLLSVGALIPSKGHDLVIRSAAAVALRPPVVVVAPRPQVEEERRLRAIADRARVGLTVHVGISDGELASLYATAHATVYLAQHEPLGLVSLEAQACGSPVIVADEGGLPETIVDGVTGWLAPRDPGTVATIIDRLSDRALRERVSQEAAKYAERWSWKASAAEIERLLAEVNQSVERQ